MVQIVKLDHLEYKEAILDGPEFREKLRKHEKHVSDTSKNIKILVKKLEDVINASEALRNAQDSFSICLKDFQLGFVGDTNEEESDIVETLDCTYNLFQDIKEFSNKMISTGHLLIKQLETFRKDRFDSFKDKKKDYERQTVRYCSTLEKYLQTLQYNKKDKNNDELSDIKEIDKAVREENQLFYAKCLDYVLCIQEFEEKWFHFFAESIFAFSQSWSAFYHEGYDKYVDSESRYNKSQTGIQALRNNLEYFKVKSKEMITDILKEPEFHMNSFQSFSNENNRYTSKQGYLYLIEKKTLGSSTRVKQYCKYYKEVKKLEVVSFNQMTNKSHQPEIYYVNNCQKSSSDKRYVFEVSLKDKNITNVHTYQALSYDDYKSWFAIMEGKELTPILSTYSIKTDPIYLLDRNGINFIKKCIQLLEDEKLNEEGIYRKNGVSHKITQFIERNFINLSNVNNMNNNKQLNNNDENTNTNGIDHNSSSSQNSSFITNVLKSAQIPIISHSTSFSTLSFLVNHQNNNKETNNINNNPNSNCHENSSNGSASPTAQNQQSNASVSMQRENSSSNLNSNGEIEDTCTITSALKHYLIHLKEPLMTFSFNQQFLIACRKEKLSEKIAELHKLLHQLPSINFEALELLMKHLFKISTHSQQNKMTTSNLATCFGPTVFRTEQECVSNLYNIKFYSEIVELLIVNHENMFQPTLDSSFLNNLIPLKTPPTMISANPINLSGCSSGGGGLNSNNTSINHNNSSLISNSANTPINTKLRPNNISVNPNFRRGIYEPSYNNGSNNKSGIMNSSKTSVSSDSSQSSDRDQQLNNSTNLLHQNHHLASPLSSSSPSTIQLNSSSSNRITISSSSSSSASTIPNYVRQQKQNQQQQLANSPIGLPNSIVPINTNNIPFKPYNSQNILGLDRDIQNLDINSCNNYNNNIGNLNKIAIGSNSSLMLPNYGNVSLTLSPMNKKAEMNSNGGNNCINSMNNNLNSSSFSIDGSNKPKRARTLYPCEADNPSELSFEANVIILNVRRSKESGWLEGTYNGKSGLVPGNYVQILDD